MLRSRQLGDRARPAPWQQPPLTIPLTLTIPPFRHPQIYIQRLQTALLSINYKRRYIQERFQHAREELQQEIRVNKRLRTMLEQRLYVEQPEQVGPSGVVAASQSSIISNDMMPRIRCESTRPDGAAAPL